MSTSTAPDLGSPARIAWTTAAVTAAVGLLMLLATAGRLQGNLGDTDDAMRLVMVRDLLEGGAWWDLHVERLQPPWGVDMHWSRLVDAGLAGVQRVFEIGVPPAPAERITRALWPLLWIVPAAAAALSVAWRLGGGRAVFATAVLLTLSTPIFAQFAPGRIDHHNVQIAMALVALAGALWSGVRGGAAAGVASALGLAVGMEALPFHAVLGAAFAARWLANPQEAAAARSYAVALGSGLLALYLVQTPPDQWTSATCDVLGANLLGAVVTACVGLGFLTFVYRERGAGVRAGGLVAVGLAAGAVYIGQNPACLGGPMAAADPRLGPIWLDHVAEAAPLWRGFSPSRGPDLAAAWLAGLGSVAAAWMLSDRARRRDPAWLIVTSFLILALIGHVLARRMEFYSAWAAAPLVAAAIARLSAERWRSGLAPTLLTAWAASTLVPTTAADLLSGRSPRATPREAASGCDEAADYSALASLPAGLVAGHIDLGANVLAHTRHSVLSAPYHRMDYGIVAAHQLLAAPAGEGRKGAGALGVDYVVSCPSLTSGPAAPSGSLRAALDAGRPPAGFALAAAGRNMTVYRVSPPAAGLRGLRGPAGPAGLPPSP